MNSQLGGTPTQVLPVGMLPAKVISRNESPSPPPLPASQPPSRPAQNSIQVNNNNNIIRGFTQMGLEDEDKKKPGLSLLANLPPPPTRSAIHSTKKSSVKKAEPKPETSEEDEPQYTGYINPRKQSASFMRLAQTLNTDAPAAGGGLISANEQETEIGASTALSGFVMEPGFGTQNRGTPEPRVNTPIVINGQLISSTNSVTSIGSRSSRGSSGRSSVSESFHGEDYDLDQRRESHPQSRSFMMLQQHLESEEGEAPKSVWDKPGGPTGVNPQLPTPSGVTPIRPVNTPAAPSPGNVTRRSQPNVVLQNCYNCGNVITGRFSRVHGRPIHTNCFRCKICRVDLMDVGYFWIEDQMYCQTHALQVAKPPAPGMVPVILN